MTPSQISVSRIASALLIALALLATVPSVHGDLTFVIEMTRHGARNPDEYFSLTTQGANFGAGAHSARWRALAARFLGGDREGDSADTLELTPTGMRQMEVLGQTLRKQYIDTAKFLPAEYNYTTLYAQSTDVNRTLQSATAQMLGLYPLGTGPLVANNLTSQDFLLPPYKGVKYIDMGLRALPARAQPVPVLSYLQEKDKQLIPFLQCPALITQTATFLEAHQSLIDAFIAALYPTLPATQDLFAMPDLTFDDLPYVYDLVLSNLFNARPLPNDVDPNTLLSSPVWKNLTYITTINAYAGPEAPQPRNLFNNNLFKQWVKYLDAAVAQSTQNKSNGGLKWVLYSAHDTNLEYALRGLNLTSIECLWQQYANGTTDAPACVGYPPYAANLLVELHDAETIKIKYNGVYLNVCGVSSTACAYDEWRARVLNQTYSTKEFDQLCETATRACGAGSDCYRGGDSDSQQEVVDIELETMRFDLASRRGAPENSLPPH